MSNHPLKIAAIVGVIAIAVLGLVFGMKSVSQSEEYKPSPGSQGGGATHLANAGGTPSGITSAPGMPGGPPAGVVPGSARR